MLRLLPQLHVSHNLVELNANGLPQMEMLLLIAQSRHVLQLLLTSSPNLDVNHISLDVLPRVEVDVSLKVHVLLQTFKLLAPRM